MAGFSFERHSGRIISAARTAFAVLFLIAVWVDPSQPAFVAEITYAILGAYVGIAVVIAALTWNNWWLDARLAAPAHIFDIATFTALVFTTTGYTSPFFVFFVFVLLAAAIRWGWYQTALTAAALIVLFLGTGLFVALSSGGEFEEQRFIIRTGHLLILSALIIWFGIHQSQMLADRRTDIGPAPLGSAVLERILVESARICGAERALLVWRGEDDALLDYRDGSVEPATGNGDFFPIPKTDDAPFLYDTAADRALVQLRSDPQRGRLSRLKADEELKPLGLSAGLAVPLRHATGSGILFLEQMGALSVDHLPLGAKLGRQIIAEIQRDALIRAVEESGESRARLALARDLHDNVVQFLAGVSFKLEAMIRRSPATGSRKGELEELKQLLLQEQKDLRTFIANLRTGESIDSSVMQSELRALCGRLASQWSIDCRMDCDLPKQPVPVRIYLDAQQLIREAVANAVRHGKAGKVEVEMVIGDSMLRLDVADDGSGLSGVQPQAPRSLNERVVSAGGTLDIASTSGGTNLSIELPLRKMRP